MSKKHFSLLAVLTAGAVLALVHLVEGSRSTLAGWVALVLLEVAGLYTHYSFVFVVLILNLAYGLWLLLTRRQHGMRRRVLLWLLSQVVVFGVLLFSPINYPADRLPEWMQSIHSVLPVQAMGEVIRGSLAADTFSLTAGPFLLLTGWCVVSLGLSYLTLRRRA